MPKSYVVCQAPVSELVKEFRVPLVTASTLSSVTHLRGHGRLMTYRFQLMQELVSELLENPVQESQPLFDCSAACSRLKKG